MNTRCNRNIKYQIKNDRLFWYFFNNFDIAKIGVASAEACQNVAHPYLELQKVLKQNMHFANEFT